MTAPPRCPRCSGGLHAPGLMTSDWTCATHGVVAPYLRNALDGLPQLLTRSRVPVWAPLPLLPGWTLTGLASVDDERTGPTAALVALSGPSPLGGPADLLLVAEEPGIGLGARCAGLAGLDPGETEGAPDAKLLAGGHPTPLWRCASAPDRMAFVGEAAGVWLWAVLWPPAAELVLVEQVALHDLREVAQQLPDLPHGAPTTRLP